MECELIWCIYNKDKECVLEVVKINGTGCCAECILPSIPHEMIEKYKKELLDKFKLCL